MLVSTDKSNPAFQANMCDFLLQHTHTFSNCKNTPKAPVADQNIAGLITMI